MTVHKADVHIDAPQEVVWEAVADFGGVWKYNPSVTDSHLLNDTAQGVGAERICNLTVAGANVQERILEWNDARDYTLEIYAGKKMPPIKNILAHISVRADGAGSVATGTLSYDPKFGPIGALMDRMLISKQFGKAWAGIFAGLKHHIETGEVVRAETDLAYEPVAYAAS